MPSSDFLLVVLCILALIVSYWSGAGSRKRPLLPPGPMPLPLLGNIFDIPVSNEHEAFTRWGKQYGDVVHVSSLGQHIIVLNSLDAANELLELRSAIYSDRPVIPMLHDPDLMDSGWSFALKQYSPEWRRHRRLFVRHLNPVAARSFFEMQTASAHTLLRSLLKTPEELAAHLRHAAAETVMGLAYGYKIQPTEDPWVALAERMSRTVGEGVRPGAYAVNIFPALKYIPAWIPGAAFKAFAATAKKIGRDLVELPFEDAKKRFASGTMAPSFVSSALADPSPKDRITDIQEVAATMYAGAADSTVSNIHSCVLAFVLTPSVQVRAQAELDAVLGPVTSPTFRLPTFEDRPRLPYIDAILNECLRWLPVLAVGVPHATTEEDVYRGWRIPKGSIVIANAWAMLHDEKIYPEPLAFRPERYLGEDPAPHPGASGCFGFGRRECPGRHLAEASLWIEIASLLAVFSFSPAKDKDGRDIDVTYAHTPCPGLLLHPQPFPCLITPRSKEAELRIRETHPDGLSM